MASFRISATPPTGDSGGGVAFWRHPFGRWALLLSLGLHGLILLPIGGNGLPLRLAGLSSKLPPVEVRWRPRALEASPVLPAPQRLVGAVPTLKSGNAPWQPSTAAHARHRTVREFSGVEMLRQEQVAVPPVPVEAPGVVDGDALRRFRLMLARTMREQGGLPAMPTLAGLSGRVVIGVTIVLGRPVLSVARSSGADAVDQLAVAGIRQAMAGVLLPPALRADGLTFDLALELEP